jgi:AraC-like DNA-binding protein
LLLTAKTTLESKLEGFEQGADEYISKPFSISFFKARVKNLLQRRNELQQFYRNKGWRSPEMVFPSGPRSETVVNEKDLAFIRSVNKFIEEHVGNHDFVIEDMAVDMGMSRTVFFKKLKGLTGLAPIEYVRDVLMQYAAEFLEQGDYAIKEVSYMVGMSDAKYFTKCFKKKFNMTPSEYKKHMAKRKSSNETI